MKAYFDPGGHLTDCAFDDLLHGEPDELARLEMYLAQGTPVLVWATCAFTEPLYNYTFTLADGSWPYSNSHCLVLTGYDEDNYYFADPMQEITEQQFDDALNVLPPLAWHTRHNVEEFCSREFYTGSYTMQYAYSLVQCKHYAKLVDYSDPSTWISSIL